MERERESQDTSLISRRGGWREFEFDTQAHALVLPEKKGRKEGDFLFLSFPDLRKSRAR